MAGAVIHTAVHLSSHRCDEVLPKYPRLANREGGGLAPGARTIGSRRTERTQLFRLAVVLDEQVQASLTEQDLVEVD